jgi:hypothetical protein
MADPQTQVDGVVTAHAKCACCGERDAELTFPGITEQTRDLAGRPIAGQCYGDLLAEGKGAREMAQRIRARDSVLEMAAFCERQPNSEQEQ